MLRHRNGRILEEIGNNPSGIEVLEDIANSFSEFAKDVKDSLARIEKALADPVEETRKEYSGSRPEALIRRVRVTTAGTAVQGPDVETTTGVATVVRMRRHATDSSRNGYVSLNEHDLSNAAFRAELQSNDAVVLNISNWDKLWFDSDTNNTDFELIAEQ